MPLWFTFFLQLNKLVKYWFTDDITMPDSHLTYWLTDYGAKITQEKLFIPNARQLDTEKAQF